MVIFFVRVTISRPFIIWSYILCENIFDSSKLLPPLTRSPSLSEGGYYIERTIRSCRGGYYPPVYHTVKGVGVGLQVVHPIPRLQAKLD